MPQTALAVNDFAPKSITAKYANFTATTAGTQIKTGAGSFLGLNVNVAGTGGANVFTLYDGISTAGPVIGAFSTTALEQLRPNALTFTTGLFAVLTGTTLSGNITVFYA
jgi:hypothetical protein